MVENPEAYIARLLSHVGDADARQILASTPARLRALTAGRSDADLRRAPAPGRWSAVQILAHLADSEIVAAWRFRTVLATDGVPLQAFDQDVWADAFKYAETDPQESLAVLEVNRRALLALLDRVDPARHAHHGLHAERGREPVAHLMRLYAGHDLNHLGQLEAILR